MRSRPQSLRALPATHYGKSGRPFASFGDGLIYDWESYKPQLRDHALVLLRASEWSEAHIGTGAILSRLIVAIEIHENRATLTNNLAFWQKKRL